MYNIEISTHEQTMVYRQSYILHDSVMSRDQMNDNTGDILSYMS